MNKTILVAGATGNLGGRICRELIAKGATVKAIVRPSSNPEKIAGLEKMGVEIFKIDTSNGEEIAAVSKGVDCVVSAMQGLGNVIVDAQKALLDGAVAARVPRFIPSDYSTDYTDLVAGENRNFDLRRKFNEHLEASPIAKTSIFNGCFTDILTFNTPILDLKKKSIGYWGDNKADWKMDFTTMDDTAAFTAEAALDGDAPRFLRIASFQVSPKMIHDEIKAATGEDFKFFQMTTLENFAAYIKDERAKNPAGENEVFPSWQGMQYMYGMFSTNHKNLDNARYPALKWMGAKAFIKSIV